MNQNGRTPEKEDIDRLISRFDSEILKRYSKLKVAIINGDERNQETFFEDLLRSLEECTQIARLDSCE